MPKPIVKIKKGSTKPGVYNVNTGAGLTAGELGFNYTDNAFYIGNNLGQAITFGAEISTDVELGGPTPSDNKIPTQKAIRSFIGSNPSTGVVASMSRYSAAPQSVIANAVLTGVAFATEEFNIGALDLNIINNSVYTYSGTTTGYYLINYQLTWQGFGTTQQYNTREIVRSAWIQKTSTATGFNLQQNVYGFSTILCPPLALTAANIGSINGVQSGVGIISLTSGESFRIDCKNHSSANYNVGLVNCQINNTGSALATNFSRASRLQIFKIG